MGQAAERNNNNSRDKRGSVFDCASSCAWPTIAHFCLVLACMQMMISKVQTLDIHGKRIRCQIWDTAGQEKFHVITRAYYRGAHGIALAYDVTDEDSFKNVNYW